MIAVWGIAEVHSCHRPSPAEALQPFGCFHGLYYEFQQVLPAPVPILQRSNGGRSHFRVVFLPLLFCRFLAKLARADAGLMRAGVVLPQRHDDSLRPSASEPKWNGHIK
jgi:hypothetical protein